MYNPLQGVKLELCFVAKQSDPERFCSPIQGLQIISAFGREVAGSRTSL
jgi:hypothetical protein